MSIKNIKKKLKDVYSNINIDIIREYIDKYMMQLIYTSVIILLLIFRFILRSNLLEKRTEDLKNDYYQALRYINTNNKNHKNGMGFFLDMAEIWEIYIKTILFLLNT